MACCGDIPTLETLAAVDLLRQHLPELKVRVVNVVDLMRLLPETEHPHGMPDAGVRLAVHGQPAGHLRLPRVPVADPPAGLPAARARQPARARVQGARHHHHALRHGPAQRPGPVPPGDRRHRPGAGAGRAGRRCPPADDRQRLNAITYTREHGEDAPEIPDWASAVLMRILVVNVGRTCQGAERGTAAAAGSHIDLRDAHRGGSRGHKCGVRRPRDQHVRIYRGTGLPQ